MGVNFRFLLDQWPSLIAKLGAGAVPQVVASLREQILPGMTDDQLANVAEAFRRALAAPRDQILALHDGMIGSWRGGHAGGVVLSVTRWTFASDGTFRHRTDSSVVSTVHAPTYAYASALSANEEHGVFVPSGPTEVLLVSASGRNAFTPVVVRQGTLQIRGENFVRGV